MLQVFYYALKAVVYPMAPVFNLQANDGIGALTPLCVKALKRVFLMSDLDKASALAPLQHKFCILLWCDAVMTLFMAPYVVTGLLLDIHLSRGNGLVMLCIASCVLKPRY